MSEVQAGDSERTLLDFFREMEALSSDYLLYDNGFRTWRYSYPEITQASRAFAARLRDSQVAAGDKVLIWSENRPQWICAFWGCVLAGATVVPIDYRASADVLSNVHQVVRAKLLLLGDDVRLPEGGFGVPSWRLAEMEMNAARPAVIDHRPAPDDIAELVFTSGSTAAPKGVVITHRNLAADLMPIRREVDKYRRFLWPVSPLRFLNLLPLSHMFGQALAMFFPPMLGGVVMLMRGYGPEEIARQIRRHRISFLVCVPKMLEVLSRYVMRRFAETAEPPSSPSWLATRWWRYRRVHRLLGAKFWSFVVGGAPLALEVEQFWSRLGFLVVQGYGLTETAPIVTFSHPLHGHPPGSAGTPLPGVEVRLAQDGEIMVRGDIVTPGYFNAPAESARAFDAGWFHTGDIGRFDETGHLFVRGRKKEMIVTPEGLNVFPEDVELVLNELPGVRDSAVVGKERVDAVLVLEPGTDKEEVVRQANARLEPYQRIRAAWVWQAGELPRTEGTGKLKRAAIQKWVDAGAPKRTAAADEFTQMLARYAPDRKIVPETTLDQLGLSSLERAELMVEMEQQFDITIDEAAFAGAGDVAGLARMLKEPPRVRETEEISGWNRSAPARAVRRGATFLITIPILRLCAQLTIAGREYLRELRGPVIFAANHQSHLDTPAIIAALPQRFRYRVAPAMLQEYFAPHFHPERYSWLQRIASAKIYFAARLFFNGFPLPQQEAGIRATLRCMGDLVSDDWSILIFPEGERTESGEIKGFHVGTATIASQLGVPVVPIRLRGLDKILHRGARIPHPGRAKVTFGQPLAMEGHDYERLTRRIEEAVRAL